MNMNVNKILQAYETEKFGYRQITINIDTSITIDPYVDIPDDFIAHAICNNLREFVNSSVISEQIVKAVHEPIRREKEIN